MATLRYRKSAQAMMAGAILFTFHSQAFANDGGAELAATLLAKTKAIDSKCKFLTSTEHDEISSYVARAEIALMRRESITATKAALAHGITEASSASCSNNEHAEVSNILAAARTAAHAAPVIVKAALGYMASVNKPVSKIEPALGKIKVGLSTYASLTERYYVARRCGSMAPREIASFYQTVVSTHRQVLSSFGRKAVASVMHESESQANAKSCS